MTKKGWKRNMQRGKGTKKVKVIIKRKERGARRKEQK